MIIKKILIFITLIIFSLCGYISSNAQSINDKNKLQQFENAITKGEEYLKAKDYAKAKNEYQKALSINPDAKYPKDKLAEIRKVFVDPQDELKYDEAIEQGDSFLKQNNFVAAKEKFAIAVTLKPEDKSAREKMLSIDKLAINHESKINEYSILIEKANKLFNEKRYQEAKVLFEKAATLNSSDSFPSTRVSEIDVIIAKQNEIDNKYNSLVLAADDAYMNRDFPTAINKYEEASKIKPTETYPKSMIERVSESYTIQKNNNQTYTTLISEADQLFNQKNYSASISVYENALKILPNEKYPSDQIRLANSFILSLKENDEKYLKFISLGDQAFKETDFEKATSYYQEALLLKPLEEYPKQIIEDIKSQILEEQNKLESSYASAIKQADIFFNDGDFDKAIEYYQQALKLKENEKYPKDAMAKASEAKQKIIGKTREISELSIKANEAFNAKEFDSALIYNTEIEKLQPNNDQVQKRISEINDILASTKKKSEQYLELINEGDKLIDTKQLEAALNKFTAAANLKPDELYPIKKIEEITKKIDDKKNLELKLAEEKRIKEANLDQLFIEAESFFAKNDYNSALEKYRILQLERPDNVKVASRINQINDKLKSVHDLEQQHISIIQVADNHFLNRMYNKAKDAYNEALRVKPDDTYSKKQLAEIERLQKENEIAAAIQAEEILMQESKLHQLVKEADALFALKDLDNALVKYQSVQNEKPDDPYVTDMIIKIKNQQKELEQLSNDYNAAIKKGDQYLKEKEYNLAEIEFKNALIIKPEDFYSRSKIDEIARRINDERTMAAKQAEQLRIKEAKLKQVILEADALFEKNDLTNALVKYQSVQKEIPGDQHVSNMVNKINERLKELEVIEVQYANTIKNGDVYLQEKQFDLAELEYQKAMKIKPSEALPKQKLYDVARLAEENKVLIAKQTEEEKERKIEFNRLVNTADGFYNNKEYSLALNNYKLATKIYSSDEYVIGKIRETTDIINQETYVANQKYNEAIEKANRFFKDGDYRSAIVQFELASSVKPLEKLPKDKLLEINNILIERSKNNLALYNKLILVADEYYQTRVYDKALEEYEKASEAYPGEQYPFKMISRIKEEMENNAIVELINNPLVLSAGVERRFNFKAIEMRARKNNYILIKAKKTSERPPKIFINYGEGNQKSGGMVMKGIESNDTRDYLLRISIQDMWYRKDNNWISLYAEGGEIEITGLQISQGDTLHLQ